MEIEIWNANWSSEWLVCVYVRLHWFDGKEKVGAEDNIGKETKKGSAYWLSQGLHMRKKWG